jgi:hypothetical protein
MGDDTRAFATYVSGHVYASPTLVPSKIATPPQTRKKTALP